MKKLTVASTQTFLSPTKYSTIFSYSKLQRGLHHRGAGRTRVIFRSSLLLVLYCVTSGFFPLSSKTTFPNSNSILECRGISERVLLNSLVLLAWVKILHIIYITKLHSSDKKITVQQCYYAVRGVIVH